MSQNNGATSRQRRRADRDRFALEMKRASGPFFLYVLLVIGGMLTAADIISHLTGTKPWDAYTQYQVAFSDVKGVASATSLREAGIEVGDVAGSRIVGNHAVVTLNLLSKYAPLYKNAELEIRPVTPLDDMYVDIVSRGTKSAGVLRPNEIVPISQTQSPVEIADVLDVFDTDTRDELSTLLNQLGAGLSGDGGEELRASFEELVPFLNVAGKMTSAMAQQRTRLAQLVHTFGGISQELDTRDTQLAQFVSYANDTLASLAHSSGPLGQTIQELPATMSAMSSAFGELRVAENSLDPALQSLHPVAQVLPTALDALSRFSTAAKPALRALLPAADQLEPMAQQLEPTARSLSGALTALKPEAPELNRITTYPAAGNCLNYLGDFLNQVITMTKFGDGADNIANARADVSVDFGNLSTLTRPISWRIAPICYDVKKGTPTA